MSVMNIDSFHPGDIINTWCYPAEAGTGEGYFPEEKEPARFMVVGRCGAVDDDDSGMWESMPVRMGDSLATVYFSAPSICVISLSDAGGLWAVGEVWLWTQEDIDGLEDCQIELFEEQPEESE